jgi:hypothetical protein
MFLVLLITSFARSSCARASAPIGSPAVRAMVPSLLLDPVANVREAPARGIHRSRRLRIRRKSKPRNETLRARAAQRMARTPRSIADRLSGSSRGASRRRATSPRARRESCGRRATRQRSSPSSSAITYFVPWCAHAGPPCGVQIVRPNRNPPRQFSCRRLCSVRLSRTRKTAESLLASR